MTESPILTTPQLESKPARRQVKFIIGAAIIFAAIGFLVFNAMNSAGAYYMTVSELKQQAADKIDRNVRVSGVVVDNSVDYDSANLILQFEIADESGQQLHVRFHGPKPDNFSRATEAIVDGKYGQDGTLVANNLLLKCPSRYEEHGGEQKPVGYEEIKVKAVN
jgi:cytochrome c-type biogenesis protein CcmE